MARELKPCGTFAAYLRHKRKGEPVDDVCAQAARDQKNGRSSKARDDAAEVFSLALAADLPVEDEVDELGDARENLGMIRVAMSSAAPRELAALSRRRQELVERVTQLERATKPGVSVLDEISQRRKDRLAKTAD